ncbi:enoyl-CoA hydratase [Roseobacter cerasinus]|uniref:Enoyl-CoA hydratase n=1 Tax=Roseobacter cerasinus TaxID=2602289 RepID=A0A640VXV8_9RHOB|nr:enoyl-CoA hydratase family protein [Roseobacter cerasinus]GFE52434.1 enoyl-CoA hydratase [Roseobacter cerasinus]
MTAEVTVEDLGDRLIVTNRNAAQRNPLSEEFYRKLGAAVEAANKEHRIGAVVLTGEGNFFCSGGNLNMLKERSALSFEGRQNKIDELQNLIRAIRGCRKPLIAAVEGGAAGAGVSLALACDFLVASKEAQFTLAYVKAGLTPDGGVTSALLQALPRALVNEMCLLATPISTERLYSLGAVNVACEQGEAMTEALALADRLVAGPIQTIGDIKALLTDAFELTDDQQLDHERDAIARALVAPEGQEGINAFLSKRRPNFRELEIK